MKFRTLGIGTCLIVLLASSPIATRAAITVSIVGGTIPAGGTGLIEVYANSDADASTPDVLNEFGITLLITPAQSSHLQFSSENDQPTDYLAAPDYIFAGTAGSYRQDPIYGDLLLFTTTNYPNDTASLGDYTLDGSTVSLSAASGPVLLAKLLLTAAPPDGGAPNPGDRFAIGLVPPDGAGVFGDPTYFDVYDLDAQAGTSPIPFASTAGTVAIADASVPEPPSAVLGAIGASILGGTINRRRRSR